MAADTTEVAMDALFNLCVPLVSEGGLPVKFREDLLVPLTMDELEENDIDADAKGWWIKSANSSILMTWNGESRVIVTTDGDPAVAARAYRAKLSQAGGRVSNEQDFAEGHYGISGEIDVSSKLYVVVNLAIGKADDAAGFYGSATLWERE